MVITNGVCWKEYAIIRDSADSGEYITRKTEKAKESKTTKSNRETIEVRKTFENTKKVVADVSAYATKEIPKETESISLNLQQDNITKIDEAVNNAESKFEEKLSKTEKTHFPIETTQKVENKVNNMSMDTGTKNTIFSDKTVDSQETISEKNMFVTITTVTKKAGKYNC